MRLFLQRLGWWPQGIVMVLVMAWFVFTELRHGPTTHEEMINSPTYVALP